MKVSPYHSSNKSDPDFYRDHSDCPTVSRFPPTTRQAAPVHSRVAGSTLIKGDSFALRDARVPRSDPLVHTERRGALVAG